MDLKYDDVLDLMNEHKINKIYVIATLITGLGFFLFGYDTAIISTSLIFVTPLFHLTTVEVSFLVAGESILAAIGALVAGPIVDKYGRKKMLIADGAMYFVFAVLTAVASSGFLLIIWRTLIGFSIGADTAIATGYISEFAPSKSRGRFAITSVLMGFSGEIAAFWAGLFLSYSSDWRLMFGLGAIPAVILLSLRFYLPESPRWLLIKDRIDDAKRSLSKFGLEITENVIKPAKEKTYRELIKEKSIRSTLLIIGLFLVFEQITGVNIILYFGPTIYTYMGLTGPRAIFVTAISESLGAIEYALSFFLIDRWGRRRLGVFGYMGIAISFILMLIGIRYLDVHLILLAVIFVFSGMTLFLLFFHIGVGGVGWVLQGETLPTAFRGRGMGILASMDWTANFIIIFIFPYWHTYIGLFSFFEFELGLSVVALIIIVLFLPETKNIPLEKMPELFSRKYRYMRKPFKYDGESKSGSKK
ncbi:sugar porter family MFS transporter [Ferroplasma sp.]|uniref:sugar porter family MFS transporter n=1 Tax=Ferroplasma sp. TaxID=2591003 RepID=UPI00263A30F3|nr:sugar porter family MFS transporter [Ferroplasma sp.]